MNICLELNSSFIIYYLLFDNFFFFILAQLLTMSVNIPNRIQDIPQRNKDLTFGFIRCIQSLMSTNIVIIIPQMIWYLITFYINDNDEEFLIHADDGDLFDELNVGLVVSTKQVTLIIEEIRFANAFLGFRNIVNNKGIHTWTLSINHMSQFEAVSARLSRLPKGFFGIVAWNEEDNNPLQYSATNLNSCSGLFWDINGTELIYNLGQQKSTKGYTTNDKTTANKITSVTMKFDANNYSVDFKINNEPYLNLFPHAKLIRHLKYKAMLYVRDIGGQKCIYSLEQYQQTY